MRARKLLGIGHWLVVQRQDDGCGKPRCSSRSYLQWLDLEKMPRSDTSWMKNMTIDDTWWHFDSRLWKVPQNAMNQGLTTIETTLLETNIFAPENGWLEYSFPFGALPIFSGRECTRKTLLFYLAASTLGLCSGGLPRSSRIASAHRRFGPGCCAKGNRSSILRGNLQGSNISIHIPPYGRGKTPFSLPSQGDNHVSFCYVFLLEGN